jgi:hypothetical protein
MVLVFSALPAIVLFLAITGHWHYGLLNLKWIVLVSGAVVFLSVRGRGGWLWYLPLLAILVVFYPFVPIPHLARYWKGVELGTAVCFVASALVLWRD